MNDYTETWVESVAPFAISLAFGRHGSSDKNSGVAGFVLSEMKAMNPEKYSLCSALSFLSTQGTAWNHMLGFKEASSPVATG